MNAISMSSSKAYALTAQYIIFSVFDDCSAMLLLIIHFLLEILSLSLIGNDMMLYLT